MKGTLTTLIVLALVGLALWFGMDRFAPPNAAPATTARTVSVERGPMQQWSVYDGKLEARRVELIMSGFSGSAVIVHLAPEGAPVKKGDLLVQFDSAQLERDLVRLERDYALAQSDLQSLDRAKLPLEERELTYKLLEAATGVQDAERQLSITRRLHTSQPDTVARREVDDQQLVVDKLRSKMEGIELQLQLTKSFLHPAARERATATRDAAKQALDTARGQLAQCTIAAPADGTVVYRPLHIGSEYRTVRVGDSIYKNQVFMALPDLRDVVVECKVPESELALVERGATVRVVPLAFRGLQLRGTVEKVGSMARSQQGQAAWQKYFDVQIALANGDPRLRSGMSVLAHVLSHRNDNALLLPRSAVRWNDDKAYVLQGGERVSVVVGRADKTHIEILSGLEEGASVELP